jgi:hypothetical protein
VTEPVQPNAPATDQPPAVTRCPWCSAALPAGAVERCPSCGAHLTGPVDLSTASIVGLGPSDGTLDPADEPTLPGSEFKLSPEEFEEAISPPSPVVQREMAKLALGTEDVWSEPPANPPPETAPSPPLPADPKTPGQ